MAGRIIRDGEKAALDGIVLQNNTWGRADLRNGIDFTQEVTWARWPADPIRMSWRWPDDPSGGIRAYPQVFAGRKPWGEARGGDLAPLPLSQTEGLSARFAADWGGDLHGFNVAFDFWVSSDPRGGPEAISHELMVWLTPGGLSPAGAAAGRVEAGPLSGTLFARPDHGGGWSYLAVVSDTEVREGTLDVGALIGALQDAGHLPREGWLMTVELGAEVRQGAGWLRLDRFEVTQATEEDASVAPSGRAEARDGTGAPWAAPAAEYAAARTEVAQGAPSSAAADAW